ncbi:protein kinase domain-containing protein [Modestobacter altitudinis]|uniref:protein kinase domain-containing protein n=1 Tax=Modestobacter altitudinis TaxID=2213158 RepID=UPI00110CCACA|nr:protein kinase [Modestobacter altitudinis]
MDEPGRRVLNDRYELDSLIASGGMGEVWRGRDVLLGRPVAVKLLRSEYTGDPTFLARFRAEATHAAALSHPNIAAVYDYGEVTSSQDGEHLAYLVMELVQGAPLSTLLREEGPLSPEATLSVLRQTAVALAEAHHAGMVHRDVKPGNILVGPDEQVKITDFGIAWSAGSVPLTAAGQVLGTPQYLSPEIAVGEQPTPASDVYSLGLVGYECLTGAPAFDGDNPVTVALKQVNEEPEPLPDDLPAELRELVDEAVAKDPGERIPDGDAFVAAIDRVRAGHPLDDPARTRAVPLVARPAVARRRPPAGPGRSRRRLRTVLPVVCALLAGIAGVLGLGLLRDDDPPPSGTATEQQQTIELDGQDYVGRPVDDVTLQLTALGLTVDRQAQSAPDVAPGQVTQLDPSDRPLYAGDAVTVFFADDTSAPAVDVPATGVTGAAAPPTQAPDTRPAAGTDTDTSTGTGTVPDTGATTGASTGATTGTGSTPAPATAPATDSAPGTTGPTGSDPVESGPGDAGSTGTPTDSTPTDAAPSETAGDSAAPTSAPDAGSTAPTPSPDQSSSEAAPTPSSAAASSSAGSSSVAPPWEGEESAPATDWTGRGSGGGPGGG